MRHEVSVTEMCTSIGCTSGEIVKALAFRHEYDEQRIPKSSGGYRTIVSVPPPLKFVQKLLHRWFEKHYLRLLQEYRLVSVVHGCVSGKSPLTNALAHRRNTEFFSCDLADAFGQVDERKLGLVFGGWLNCDLELQETLFYLTTRNGTVPQGAPTSQDLLNLSCLSLDGYLKRQGFRYTRYVDNFYFSGRDSGRMDAAVPQIIKVIEQSGFALAPEKSKRQSVRNGSIPVTGVSINQVDFQPTHVLSKVRTTVRLPRKTIRKVRAMLHQAAEGKVTQAEVRGMLGWVRYVSRGGLPNMLEKPYEQYLTAMDAGIVPP
jgi:hypothetical protein